MNKFDQRNQTEPVNDKAGKDRQALEAKFAELQAFYQQNELTILRAYP